MGAGQAETSIDAVVVAPGTSSAIGGLVSESGGQPVAGLKINLFTAGADGLRQTFLGPAFTGADGRYRYDVGPGSYIVVFIAPDGRTFTGSGASCVNTASASAAASNASSAACAISETRVA